MPDAGGEIGLEVLRARSPEGMPAHETPLLFLHGAFAGAWCWSESFLPGFATQGWDCTAFSFRGHGESGGRSTLDEFGIADYVRDLSSVIADMDRPPILVGHSMGGFVAMRYLQEAGPARVAGLALLASVPPGGLWGASLSMMTFQPNLFYEISQIQGGHPSATNLRTLKTALFTPDTPDGAAAIYYARMNGESRRAVLELNSTARIDAAAIAGLVPTLVLGAEKDALIPPAYVRATGRALGSRADILPGIGHGMMLGRDAHVTAGRLARWLAECGFA
ncbi:alpha/beta fold hydrolase [Marivibrio halodurans]|uniref:Alpha/beta fold hydrolase n=1 Tax=Marivibrio halodurans TaxID=2039722 RepID=A0A8J7SHV2_9PROT|nr:alpha/beta hydrolase [Marivibrio halodurans]MBP5856673.1 alpha/beta fold hydrolase [Marivibrio halodurans]